MHIQTPHGPKQIRDVVPGDEVYSWDDGNLRLSRITRLSTSRRQMTYRLRTGHREIIASGNHPFLVIQRTGQRLRSRPSDTECSEANCQNPGYARGVCRRHYMNIRYAGQLHTLPGPVPGGTGKADGYELAWVELSQLRRGDVIVALQSLPDDRPMPDDEWLSNPDYLWLLGAMFGDGWLSHGRNGPCELAMFGEQAQQALEILSRLTSHKLTAYPVGLTGGGGIRWYDRTLSSALRRDGAGDYSTERTLPEVLWTLPHKLIQAFLDGYTTADGHTMTRPRDPGLSYSAANETLIRQVRNLHMILGHNVTQVREQKRSTEPQFIKGKQIKSTRSLWCFQAYEAGNKVDRLAADLLHRPGIAKFFPADSHFSPKRVLAVESLEEADTYDITVEGTHNYVAEGLLNHNSGFTEFVYDHFGWTPPRTSEAQFGWVKRVADPVPGALAFFAGSPIDPPPGHVGIVTSPDTMIDAYGTGYGTIYNTINGSSGTVMGFGIPPSGFKFDNGGWLQPGATMVVNTTGKPEPVLTGDQWNVLSSAAGSGALGDKLDRIANLLAAGPRATGAATGEVVNGSAHSASFRSRYPRNR